MMPSAPPSRTRWTRSIAARARTPRFRRRAPRCRSGSWSPARARSAPDRHRASRNPRPRRAARPRSQRVSRTVIEEATSPLARRSFTALRTAGSLMWRPQCVAIALPAHVAAIGRAEMHRHDERFAFAGTLERGCPRHQRLVGPQAVAVVPVRPYDLDRIVHDVGGEQAFLAARADADDSMPGAWPGTGSGARHPATSLFPSMKSASRPDDRHDAIPREP